MYINSDKERALYRVLGYIDGVAATIENDTVRRAIYDALEQLENALTEEPPHD